MTLQSMQFDRKKLTIYGVKFPDLDTFDSVATAITSQMYEGFCPNKKLLKAYRDFRSGKINTKDLALLIHNDK